MAELEELFDADARGAKNLHDRPGPEGSFLLEREVAAPAGGILDPDAVSPGPAHEGRSRGGEGLAGSSSTSGIEEFGGPPAIALERGHERGEHRQTLTGAGVHP